MNTTTQQSEESACHKAADHPKTIDQDMNNNEIDEQKISIASIKSKSGETSEQPTTNDNDPSKYLYSCYSTIVEPIERSASIFAYMLATSKQNQLLTTEQHQSLTTDTTFGESANLKDSIWPCSDQLKRANSSQHQHARLTIYRRGSLTTETGNDSSNNMSAMNKMLTTGGAYTSGQKNINNSKQQQVALDQPRPNDVDNNGECSRRNSYSLPERNLLYCSLEQLKLKDFGCEIRALMDVEQFVHQAILLMDVNHIIVEDIVDSMLRKIISVDRHIPQCVINEAKCALFINKSAGLLSRTIQGIQVSAEPMLAGLDYDQSWLCSMCNLPTISKRHVAIARLKHQVNMGKNAHEVRFFIMIVTPSKEKGTKNALETGRTFATIFSDINFRQVLLNARNESEFKLALLNYTRKLTNAHSVNIEADQAHRFLGGQANDYLSHEAQQQLELDPMQMPNQNDDHHQQQKQLQDEFNLSIKHRLPANIVDNKLASLFNNEADSSQCSSIENVNSNSDEGRSPADIKFSRMDSGIGQSQQQQVSCLKMTTNHKRQQKFPLGNGLCADFRRRLRFFGSDFRDGFAGPKTIHKTISTIVFLYFGILLPTIAFGVLNTTNTNGNLGDIRKAIIGQAIGGLLFALFGGQPLVIIMTTAPLCLYTKVIFTMCEDYNYPFLPMYAAVGLWNGFFLMLYSVLDVSRLMKWCTRSTEEIFALFIAIAFGVDAGRDLIKNFNRYYYSNACLNATDITVTTIDSKLMLSSMLSSNETMPHEGPSGLIGPGTVAMKDIFQLEPVCRRESSLLFIILMFGTLWLGLALYNFNRTPYLQASKREMLADYALPTAVIVMSFVGSYVFEEIHVEKFTFMEKISFERTHLTELSFTGCIMAMGLGFTLSLLFFMDQNISAAMVNSPQNKLKKGCAYHYDLMVVGLLNGLLTLYGLPMMHGVLPHSPLHVRSLADIEERVEQGHVKEIIINVRETRVTGIVAHLLICLSIFLIPYPIAYIPTAVLDGLFLYMAATSLDGLQMFERITLLFMEQSAYPPNHYIRRCPQRKIHEFTLVQVFQLSVMCFFGFSPSNTIEMFFPVVILLMLPFRYKMVPHYIEDKYLEALDGRH